MVALLFDTACLEDQCLEMTTNDSRNSCDNSSQEGKWAATAVAKKLHKVSRGWEGSIIVSSAR